MDGKEVFQLQQKQTTKGAKDCQIITLKEGLCPLYKNKWKGLKELDTSLRQIQIGIDYQKLGSVEPSVV